MGWRAGSHACRQGATRQSFSQYTRPVVWQGVCRQTEWQGAEADDAGLMPTDRRERRTRLVDRRGRRERRTRLLDRRGRRERRRGLLIEGGGQGKKAGGRTTSIECRTGSMPPSVPYASSRSSTFSLRTTSDGVSATHAFPPPMVSPLSTSSNDPVPRQAPSGKHATVRGMPSCGGLAGPDVARRRPDRA